MPKIINKKQILGIDLDDTLWDLVSAWIGWFNQSTSSELKKEDIKNWDIASFVKPQYTEHLFNILDYPLFWRSVMPIPESQECLKELCEDYDVRIVTASKYLSFTDKMIRFFELYPFIDEDKIIKINDKKILKLDGLVDDGFHNLQFGDYHKFMVAQPWNEDCLVSPYNIIRVTNWKDIVNKIHMFMPLEGCELK